MHKKTATTVCPLEVRLSEAGQRVNHGQENRKRTSRHRAQEVMHTSWGCPRSPEMRRALHVG